MTKTMGMVAVAALAASVAAVLTGVTMIAGGDKEAVIIQFGRELFGRHYVSADTYAHALQLFGERDLVDFVNLMAQHADDATMLTAFDQRLPAGEKPLLPMP